MIPYSRPGLNAPPGVGGFPGQQGPPQNFGNVPGFAAPPGMDQAQPAYPPGNFMPPPNMANFDMNAKVIRMGTGGNAAQPGGMRRDDQGPPRRGLGASYGRDGDRRDENRAPKYELTPLSHEEQMRTIGVSRIPKDLTDEWLEQLLNSAGGLRRYTRVLDSNYKPTHMAFAEFEDADSLRVAIALFAPGIPVPLNPRTTRPKANGAVKHEGVKIEPEQEANIKVEEGTVEAAVGQTQSTKVRVRRLKIILDEQSVKYVEQWGGRTGSNEDQIAFRIENGQAELRQVFLDIKHIYNTPTTAEGATETVTNTETGEVVTIPLSQAQEDELSDIPPEQREQVIKEISNFRQASMIKDAERIRQQEEDEEWQRRRASGRPAASNNVPVGPRATINGPNGPAGWTGGRLPHPFSAPAESHYDPNGDPVHRTRDGVVYRFGPNNEIVKYDPIAMARDERTDDELNEARIEELKAEERAEYEKDLKSWLDTEETRVSAHERKVRIDTDDEKKKLRKREEQREYLHNFNDDRELERGEVEYLIKPKEWAAKRERSLQQEMADDEKDRQDEENEKRKADERHQRGMGEADDFLKENVTQPFRMSLGAAAQRVQTKPQQRRGFADVEGFLDNEAEEASERRPRLVPLPDAQINNRGARMTDEERQDAITELVRSLPTDRSSLWAWNVRWDAISLDLIEERIRKYMDDKIYELVGSREEEMVDALEDLLKKRATPDEMVTELEPALEDEAEGLVRKIWRMVVFYGESEFQGLGA